MCKYQLPSQVYFVLRIIDSKIHFQILLFKSTDFSVISVHFFKFKVCIFILFFPFFPSYGVVLELYCSCACNVINFTEI